jgi:DNA-binding MarR family transcriptional regulator
MDNSYDRGTSGGYVTNRAARLFIRALDRRLLHGSAGQMPVFLALMDGSAYTQTELARLASVEQPTMANTLGRMERDGLIARTPDPADRRSSLVSLNKLGRTRAGEAMAAALAVNEAAFATLDADERAMFFDLLHRVIAALEADGKGEMPSPHPDSA